MKPNAASDLMNDDLRERTITGVSWSAISQGVNQGFGIAISVVLARILGPKAYGLIGMVTVFTGFAAVFGDLALGAAIIQRKELEERHLNAAFWTNVIMGATLTLMMVALAPVVSWFYTEPALLTLTMVIALKYIIDSLYVVQLALLKRGMRFRTLAGIQIGSNVISGLAGLGFALYGMGPWSLVAQTLGFSVVLLVVSWRLGGWRPRLSFELRACKELFGFSAYVLGSNAVNYWARTLDQLLTGRFIGAAALGIYSRAYTLMLMPLTQVSVVVGRVMFPVLSTIQDDKPRVKRVYVKSICVIGLITFPMMIGAFVVSEHLILAVLGDKWAGAIPIFKIFCWVGLLQSIATTTGWIFMSQGRTGVDFALTASFTAFYAIGFVIGIRWGIIGLAWSYFMCNLVLWYPSWVIPGRLIGITFSEMLRSLSPAFFCALSMGAIIWGLGRFLPYGMAHWQYLAIQIPLGLVLYFVLVVGLRLDSWQEGRRALSEVVVGRLKTREFNA
jgi:O-antigen/teichoic acid export membrane protein